MYIVHVFSASVLSIYIYVMFLKHVLLLFILMTVTYLRGSTGFNSPPPQDQKKTDASFVGSLYRIIIIKCFQHLYPKHNIE